MSKLLGSVFKLKDNIQVDFISKANMAVVNELLDRLPDWENFLLKRHHKFVKHYLENGRDLRKTGEKFDFSYNDMLSIFWRIQKQLQTEHSKRIGNGILEKKVVVIKSELKKN